MPKQETKPELEYARKVGNVFVITVEQEHEATMLDNLLRARDVEGLDPVADCITSLLAQWSRGGLTIESVSLLMGRCAKNMGSLEGIDAPTWKQVLDRYGLLHEPAAAEPVPFPEAA